MRPSVSPADLSERREDRAVLRLGERPHIVQIGRGERDVAAYAVHDLFRRRRANTAPIIMTRIPPPHPSRPDARNVSSLRTLSRGTRGGRHRQW